MTERRPAVLVVDDSALVVEALGTLLELGGYTPATASTVAAAVTALQEARYDAMLLDLTLPDGDGLEVLARAGAGAPPTLALTGHDDPETEARCRAAGCAGVLVKPVRGKGLLDALKGLAIGG